MRDLALTLVVGPLVSSTKCCWLSRVENPCWSPLGMSKSCQVL